MKNLNILHITDLHINDVNSPNEKLRKAFYVEFINGLKEKINETVREKIDYIFCTGDFINKGLIENFTHSEEVLNYLGKVLNVPRNNFATCIGNHDFVIETDKSGDQLKARSDYYKLEKVFHPDNLLHQEDFYKIYHDPLLDIYILSFDSTIGAKGTNKPSKLTDLQIDNVMMKIDEHIPTDKALFVLSHYPMIIFNRSQAIAEVDGWVDDHLWKSGSIMVERIYKKRKNTLTFWFFGDGHLPHFWSYNPSHHFLMTGMIGGNYVNPTYNIDSVTKAYNKTNEAKLITFNSEENRITIHTYQYKSEAYEFNPHTGFWDYASSDIRLVDNPFERNQIAGESFTPVEIPRPIKVYDQTLLISDSVQKEIIDEIRQKKLYTFNRFATSSSETSLAWISLTKLFENNELLSRCIQKSNEWLQELKINIQSNNSLFIGIDFWGAIFASQSSILSDVENYCIATKSRNTHNILLEKPHFLQNKIMARKDTLENIIFFTDVVTTGHTLIQIQTEINQWLSSAPLKINFIGLSIISDTKQVRKPELNNFFKLGSLCTDLRIPILQNSELPDLAILPIKYDIR